MNLQKIEEFENIINSDEIVIVEFYSKWCPPCKMLSFVLEELAEIMPEQKILRINTSEFNEFSTKLGVYTLPSMLFYQSGKVLEKHQGLIDVDELVELLKTLRNNTVFS